MSIQSEINRISGAKETMREYLDGSGVAVPSDASIDEMAALLASVPGGGPAITPKPSDINFYDYDGTLLYSWTLTELAAKTSLPALPTHAGLVCQEWNWTLAQLKSVNTYVDVGATYTTDDGKTRIYVTITEATLNPTMSLSGSGSATVSWGDGTEADTITATSTITHEYSLPGSYLIEITVLSGNFQLTGSTGSTSYGNLFCHTVSTTDTLNYAYLACVKKIELGDSIDVSNGAFASCVNLETISISQGSKYMSGYLFYSCCSLTGLVIPSSSANDISSLSTYQYCMNCTSLRAISFPNVLVNSSRPENGGLKNQAFYMCGNLKRLILPSGLSCLGSSSVRNCISLKKLHGFSGLSNFLRSGNSLSAYYSLQACYSLKELVIGRYPFSSTDGYTTVLQQNFAQNCRSLVKVTFPVNTYGFQIGALAFANCYGVLVYDFTSSSDVPSLKATSAFTNIRSDCKILVPAALESSWKSATNWSTYASHIVGV